MNTPKSSDNSPSLDASVKEVTTPAQTVSCDRSVEEALGEMKTRGVESSLVTDDGGALLGNVSKDELQHNVGGLGHDPKAEPVQGQVQAGAATCFDDQTISQAKQIMLDAKMDNVSVVTRETVLVGTANLQRIAAKEDERDHSDGA